MTGRPIKVIACATVIEEIKAHASPDVVCQTLDFGLHVKPAGLREELQKAIDATHDVDHIVLGYGLCSMAVIGLVARRATLVIPRVDDCIAIFLGSREAHLQQLAREPGTYYLTKGWIEVGDTPFDEYDRLVERYGPQKAKRMMNVMFAHYSRLALINTGVDNLDRYREYTRTTAERFDLRYEEIPGSPALVQKMVHGPWDDDFVVAEPGHVVAYSDFHSFASSA